jgi:prophage DNA circulation protein
MSTIKDIHLPFRDEWQGASFRGAAFFCEAGGRDNGRRVVVHEFPKKDQPYSEDMGRRAYSFTVRGYCVTAVKNMGGAYSRDYRSPRDRLISALDQSGPGTLTLPTGLAGLSVMCTRYRVSEEEKLGGYCIFDMEFAEAGQQPNTTSNSTSATAASVGTQSANVQSNAIASMNGVL